MGKDGNHTCRGHPPRDSTWPAGLAPDGNCRGRNRVGSVRRRRRLALRGLLFDSSEEATELGASIIAGRLVTARVPAEFSRDLLVDPPSPTRDSSSVFDLGSMDADFSSRTAGPIPAPFLHSIALIKRDVFDAASFDTWYAGNSWREGDRLLSRRERTRSKGVFYAGHSLFSSSRSHLRVRWTAHQPPRFRVSRVAKYPAPGLQALELSEKRLWSARSGFPMDGALLCPASDGPAQTHCPTRNEIYV